MPPPYPLSSLQGFAMLSWRPTLLGQFLGRLALLFAWHMAGCKVPL